MPTPPLTIEQILILLAQTPARIATLTDALAPTQLRTAPSQGEWSANDVLAHLRSCADMWGDAIAVILAEDAPTISRCQSHHLDQADGLPRTGISAFAACLCRSAHCSTGGIGAASTRRVVTCRDSYGGGKAH